MLKWEGRMDELMKSPSFLRLEEIPDALESLMQMQDFVLEKLIRAHDNTRRLTFNSENYTSSLKLLKRRVVLLGKMERFRDQGGALCAIAENLHALEEDTTNCCRFFQEARDLGEKHGFFSVECRACKTPEPKTLDTKP